VLNEETYDAAAGVIPPLQYQDTVLVTAQNVNQVNPVDFYGPNVN
jgi:hypothetical protein